MIENERQYNITQAQARRFEEALARLQDQAPGPVQPLLREAQAAGIRAQLQDLRTELADYDGLRSGSVSAIECDSLEGLPQALIRARIAAGMTQRELGRALGLKEQQVQRYEASRYASASLSRVTAVGRALGLRFLRPATLGVGRVVYAIGAGESARLRVADAPSQ
jgi:DNA-binding XRE family transcriptional regulator